MKAAFIVRWHPDTRMGGVEIWAANLAEELARRGWEVVMITEDERDYKRHVNGYLHIALKSSENILKAFKVFPKMYRLLNLYKPDIYIQFGSMPHTALVGFIAQKKNKPFVWISGGDIDVTKDRFKYYFESSRRLPQNILAKFVIYVLNRAYIYGIKKSSLAILMTNSQQDKFENIFSGKRSLVIPIGHPVPRFSKVKKTDPPHILWVSNIKSIKRPDLFIKLAEKMGNFNAKFIMVGFPQEKHLADWVAEKARSLPNLEYLGGVSIDRVNQLLERAYVLLNTSVSEGLPNVFIQAWMRGTPVISLNVDPDNLIERFNLGFYSRTFEKMCEDVANLLADRQRWEEMSRNCLEFSREYFSLDRIVALYDMTFKKLLERTNSYGS